MGLVEILDKLPAQFASSACSRPISRQSVQSPHHRRLPGFHLRGRSAAPQRAGAWYIAPLWAGDHSVPRVWRAPSIDCVILPFEEAYFDAAGVRRPTSGIRSPIARRR
jgi:hypothetical protein